MTTNKKANKIDNNEQPKEMSTFQLITIMVIVDLIFMVALRII